MDRDARRLDAKGYVGIVGICPLRKAINSNRGELPKDYFCDHICSTIYPEGYRMLGLRGSVRKSETGCKVEIDLR